MVHIIHRFRIKASPVKVTEALATINGLAAWWTEGTSGNAQHGGSIEFRFRNPEGKVMGGMDMEVTALEPGKKVHWRCKEGPADWLGTDITFDLRQDGDFTTVLFGHRNWKEESESKGHCSMKWATFMLSLKGLLETGKGRPFPHDIQIDD